MILKFVFVSLLVMIAFVKSNADECSILTGSDCGKGCTGKPHCDGKQCGNVDDMCYCDCSDVFNIKCKTSDLGYTWNDGIEDKHGNYALNGTYGDKKEYIC
jgi:hypothetical protein